MNAFDAFVLLAALALFCVGILRGVVRISLGLGGMILGLVVGAANDSLPENLMTGLVAHKELKAEIESFAEIALGGNGI